MGLNKQSGNMYSWVTYTWNIVKGRCTHDCKYCYMKVYSLNPIRLDEGEFNTDLGRGNVIFVGSSCDMWAEEIPTKWINLILNHILKYPENIYLFQSKNPKRFDDFILPPKVILGTTMETNRVNAFSLAPSVLERYKAMKQYKTRKMISIEPIMDFDLNPFVSMVKDIKPEFISIGADSKGHNLPEPSKNKTLNLIDELKKVTEVKLKDNLCRIINQKEK